MDLKNVDWKYQFGFSIMSQPLRARSSKNLRTIKYTSYMNTFASSIMKWTGGKIREYYKNRNGQLQPKNWRNNRNPLIHTHWAILFSFNITIKIESLVDQVKFYEENCFCTSLIQSEAGQVSHHINQIRDMPLEPLIAKQTSQDSN